MNARESLHKGCGGRSTEMEQAAGRIGGTGRGKARGERCFVLSHAAVCIVNLEAADIELDDDYRVARYS